LRYREDAEKDLVSAGVDITSPLSSSNETLNNERTTRASEIFKWADYEDIPLASKKTLTSHHHFLMEPHLLGFSLKDKHWSEFTST
jgi:hypothetical protein